MNSATTLFARQALLQNGWATDVRIVCEDRRIALLDPDSHPQPSDHRAFTLLPGLPNLHSHAFQRGIAGMAETRAGQDDDFWTWREAMYRFVHRMEPEDIEAISALAFAEMLEAGFTGVAEFHYLHHDPAGRPYADPAELSHRVAAAADTAGIRLTLLPVFYAHGGFGGVPPAPGQRRFVCAIDGFARLLECVRQIDCVRIGVAAHSLRAVTPDELAAVLRMQPAGPLHIHAAEQVAEVEACLAWSGLRPVEWLLEHAEIDARWSIIHATHMTPGETARLAGSGAVAGLCPVTEANLGDGIFPGAAFHAAGGRFGVGTDSNVGISAASELRQLEYSQRLALGTRNVLASADGRSTGRTLLDAALAGGATSLGVPAPALRAGGPADFVTLAPGLLDLEGDQVLDNWIFASGAVDGVWVGGQQLVTHGRHHARERIAREARQALRRVLT